MQSYAGGYLYRFRHVWVSLSLLGCVLLFSAFITVLGAHTALAASPHEAAASISEADSGPNAVFNATSSLLASAQKAGISTASALYGGCRSITEVSVHSGHFMATLSSGTIHGVGVGAAFVTHGLANATIYMLRTTGSAIMFTARLPGRLTGSVANTQPVSSLIRPADEEPTPVINNQTSTAVLAKLDAQQKQLISNLQAEQLAANEELAGSIVAGDPHHGGYPAIWDAPVAQDSRLDSWGMYNRECVSYTAWKVYQTFGFMPYWGGVGNASQWLGDAQNAGIATSLVPKVHAVAISQRGYYGHAMWVEAVRGGMIYVSQYNYGLDGRYSEMWVNGSSLTYIYFK
jgi:surface antigen